MLRNDPVMAWKRRGVQVACWKDERGGHRFMIHKVFRGKDNKWHKWRYFWGVDLQILFELVTEEILPWCKSHNVALTQDDYEKILERRKPVPPGTYF